MLSKIYIPVKKTTWVNKIRNCVAYVKRRHISLNLEDNRSDDPPGAIDMETTKEEQKEGKYG